MNRRDFVKSIGLGIAAITIPLVPSAAPVRRITEDLYYAWETDWQTRDGAVYTREEIYRYEQESYVLLKEELYCPTDFRIEVRPLYGEVNWRVQISKGTLVEWCKEEKCFFVIDNNDDKEIICARDMLKYVISEV